MADKDTLWTAVVARYPSSVLVALTNVDDPSGTSVDTAYGTEAANGVINLWPLYAQVDFDVTDATHLEVAARGVIAQLQERGGVSSQMAKIEWDEVFGDNGLIAKVSKTGPRGRQGPTTNSNIRQSTGLTESGGRKRAWADKDSLPSGILPSDQGAVT